MAQRARVESVDALGYGDNSTDDCLSDWTACVETDDWFAAALDK